MPQKEKHGIMEVEIAGKIDITDDGRLAQDTVKERSKEHASDEEGKGKGKKAGSPNRDLNPASVSNPHAERLGQGNAAEHTSGDLIPPEGDSTKF